MKRVRYSLQTLRIFDAVARAGSITSAAATCGLTQSAVTKHVLALEDNLGTALLERTPQGVTLTAAGERYLRAVRRALRILDIAHDELASDAPAVNEIALGVAPAVAQRWLIPRLDQFVSREGVRVRLVPRISQQDALAAPCYAEIRFGYGRFPGWTSRYLIGRDYRFVIGAARHRALLRAGIPTDRIGPQLLQALPILFHVLGPEIWDQALDELRIARKRLPLERIGFEQYSVLIPAAVAGQGLALVPRFLIEEELANGQLLDIADIFRGQTSFYLLTPRGKPRAPALEAFGDWLVQQARATPGRG